MGKVAEALVKPGWAELSNGNRASPFLPTFLGSVLPKSWEEAPG